MTCKCEEGCRAAQVDSGRKNRFQFYAFLRVELRIPLAQIVIQNCVRIKETRYTKIEPYVFEYR
jgi:hypothetical protein